MVTVFVELLGIPRVRAGVANCSVQLQLATLAELLAALSRQFPGLAGECIQGETLARGYLACLNETVFTTRPEQQLLDGDRILILSADVGG